MHSCICSRRCKPRGKPIGLAFQAGRSDPCYGLRQPWRRNGALDRKEDRRVPRGAHGQMVFGGQLSRWEKTVSTTPPPHEKWGRSEQGMSETTKRKPSRVGGDRCGSTRRPTPRGCLRARSAPSRVRDVASPSATARSSSVSAAARSSAAPCSRCMSAALYAAMALPCAAACSKLASACDGPRLRAPRGRRAGPASGPVRYAWLWLIGYGCPEWRDRRFLESRRTGHSRHE